MSLANPISLIKTVLILMTPEQFEQLQKGLTDAVAAQVKITVNGKIDRLNQIMEEQKDALIAHTQEDKITAFKLESYISKDEQEWKDWKIKAQPSLDLGTNLRGFGKVLAYMIATIGGLVGVTAAIIALIRKLK